MVADPYVYEGTHVLKNKFGTKNQDTLEKLEADYALSKMVNVDEKVKGNFDFKHLKDIHKHIFGDIYEWAGDKRVLNIYKDEVVLSGVSVQYSSHDKIEKDMEKAINELKGVKWESMSLQEFAKEFTPKIADIWKVHPFREGNTRTSITFACQYADSIGFTLEKEVFRSNSGYVRNALVLAAAGEYAECKYLQGKIIEAVENAHISKLDKVREGYIQGISSREKEILGYIKDKIKENPRLENLYKLEAYLSEKVKENLGAEVHKNDLKLIKNGISILEGVERAVIKDSFNTQIGQRINDKAAEQIRVLNRKEDSFFTHTTLEMYRGDNKDLVKGILNAITLGKDKNHIR